jgi:hypothetical protein
MRSRRSHTAFSLFSFQDIITSVTAILLLILLLLTLEMVSRRRQEAVTDPAVSRAHLDTVTASLEEMAERLRRDLAKAQRTRIDRRTRDDLEAEAKRSEVELVTVRERLNETARTRRMVADVRQATEQLLAGLDGQRDLLAALAGQSEADHQVADQLESDNQQERERQARQRQSGAELIFNISQDASQRSWLVELSRDGAVAVLVGGTERQALGSVIHDSGPLTDWIRGLDPAGDRCLLLLRPSVDLAFAKALEQALEQRTIGFGRDIVGEEEAVRVGSAVAAGKAD